MASLQVDATPAEDVITEAEATTKEQQVVAPPPPPPPPPPPETVKTVDGEDEEDLEGLTVPPYEDKVENSEDEEEKDVEYSPFVEREDAPPYRYAGDPASFGDFDEEDDAEDEDDAIN